MIKALFNAKKVFTSNYPLLGASVGGRTAPFVVDLVKQGVKDTFDTISVNLHGNVVIAGAGAGVATGAENPWGLVTLSTLSTAPQAAGLIPVNAISSRALVFDYAAQQGSFDANAAIADAAGVTPIDVWVHYKFKRDYEKKGIEYAHPMTKWNSDLLTLVLGDRSTLFAGGTNTWDLTGVIVDVWGDLDVDANPDNIHAVEIFEQVFQPTAANTGFLINTLPQGCLYDSLYLIAETAGGVVSDTLVNNIDIEGGGRNWSQLGETNADFIKERWTKPMFFDQAGGAHGIVGFYAIPLRDGLWSRAMDASGTPIVLKIGVTGACTLRLFGRKIVPGGIKKTIKDATGKKTIIGLPDVSSK